MTCGWCDEVFGICPFCEGCEDHCECDPDEDDYYEHHLEDWKDPERDTQ